MSPVPAVRPLTIMLVVGEPSGDALGAQLIAALRELSGGTVRLVGVGGPAMAAEGFTSLFPIDDTAVMGLKEVVPRIPKILRRVREAAEFAARVRPDLAVMIDSPDFTHRVAARIKKLAPDIRVVNYVAPQVWASRPYRAVKMRRWFDHVLALLPFEAPFFESKGLPAAFVGHPVIERKALMTGGAGFRERHGIPPNAKLLLVLPGSRLSEIRFILPAFSQAAHLIAARVPGLKIVVPTVPNVAQRVRDAVLQWSIPALVIDGLDEKFAAFDAADAALAASGTVTTELALAGVPMVVAYKLGALTAALARPFVKAPHITIANLILGRRAIPEFVQEQATPQRLADEIIRLLTNKAAARKQVDEIAEAMAALGVGGDKPSRRAARTILELAQPKTT